MVRLGAVRGRFPLVPEESVKGLVADDGVRGRRRKASLTLSEVLKMGLVAEDRARSRLMEISLVSVVSVTVRQRRIRQWISYVD
jgi:hypothetical protein